MNLFSLHGKWYGNNENRLTSNVLFFLSRFPLELLTPFLSLIGIHADKREIARADIRFQCPDDGKIPDGEIVVGDDTRILLESKIRDGNIGERQIRDYVARLEASKDRYSHLHFIIITQTNQAQTVSDLAVQLRAEGALATANIHWLSWRQVLEMFQEAERSAYNPVLSALLGMFLEEIGSQMYNRIDIGTLALDQLNEIVLTSQNADFYEMAMLDGVFWPRNNFRATQFVAYYFTDDCPQHGKSISHLARIRHIWHNITIDEVLTSVPEFQTVPDFKAFEQRALKLYPRGNPMQFAIALTDLPIALPRPIPYVHDNDLALNALILPGKHTTLSKLLTARSLIDLA